MKHYDNDKKAFRDSRIFFCIMVFISAVILIGITLWNLNGSYSGGNAMPYDETWTYESGSLADFDNLITEEHVTIHKRIDGDVINTKSLCFHSKNIHFSVYLDGEMIYDFHPKTPKYMGKSYGVYSHSVTMPVITRDGDIKIVIDHLYPGKPGYVKDMHLDSSNHFIVGEIQDSSIELLACVITIVFGVILALIGLFGRNFGDKRYEIVSFGAFSTAAALWIATGTQADALLTGAPVAVHFANYMALDLMTYPGVIFAAYITGNKESKLSIGFGMLTLTKIIFSIISTCIGFRDYHQLLFLTHIIIVLGIIAFTYYLIKGIIKKTLSNVLSIVVIVLFALALIVCIFDVIMFFSHMHNYITFSISTSALYIFILVCGIYEFENITEMSKRGQYAEAMEQMAYQDELTHMLNRKAFNRTLQEIEKGTDSYTFVMLDLNNLKNVNDEYGHEMGDTYIISIADYICRSFQNKEKCYRIGGDEFFVISEYKPTEESFKKCLTRMSDMIAEFNQERKPPIELSIAYGYEVYDPTKDKQNKILRVADERMYEMKAQMKLAKSS